MAILKNGLYGELSGKLGNVVAYKILGKTVIRMVGKSKRPATEKQRANWHDMTVVNKFLKPILLFVRVGLKLEAAKRNMYAHNLAVSYHKKHALKGVYPNREIDYKKVLLAEGKLTAPENPMVELQEDGLNFVWDTIGFASDFEQDDQVMVMAYFPVLSKAFFITGGAARSTGRQLLPLPVLIHGEYMETYIAFVAKNMQNISNSVYTGSFNKPPIS